MKYDPDSHTLRIIYVSGMVYDYREVPPEVFASMQKATSKGRFLNKYIKGLTGSIRCINYNVPAPYR
ncbi:KTSC domain-containing protein [Chitinophaga sedimenti]|nr:KTSC domain-containing protein [Chitinophaga sedimenti]